MRVLDLFSGIGGFSLGLERAGMRTVAFCEIDPFCRAVLAKHWPAVICYDDIRTLDANRLFQDSHGELPDVICGGFPCQDISYAGDGAGLAGERSGLWSEYARLIGEIRPSFVIVENVSALLSRGLGDVLRDLAALRYDAEWHCIPASSVGAPHRRDRFWLVGYPHDKSESAFPVHDEAPWLPRAIADAAAVLWASEFGGEPDGDPSRAQDVADAGGQRLQGAGDVSGEARHAPSGQSVLGNAFDGRQWRVEPDVGRVANGVPARVDRLRSLGNSVVPQITEILGRAIVRASVNVNEGL